MNDDIIVTVDHSLWSHSDVALCRRQRITVEVRELAARSALRTSPERALWWISRELHQTVHSLTGIDPEKAAHVQLVFPLSSVEEALSLIVAKFNKTRPDIRGADARLVSPAGGMASIRRIQN